LSGQYISDDILRNPDKYKMKNRIKMYRAEKDLTQKELGALIHVTRQTVAVIEQGRQIPSLDLVHRMAKVFGRNIEELFYYEEV